MKGQSKVSQQIQGSDPEIEGGDGVPYQGHPGKGSRIEALSTANGSFIEYIDCLCISAIYFFTSIKLADFKLCCAI